MSQGKVTEALLARIRRQVDEHQLVLWLDPERHYGDVPALLANDGVPVETYRDGVFALRHRIDGVLAGPERSPLVVYVPLPEADVLGPLAELAAAAMILKPGQQPAVRNTRLTVVARAALADRLPAAALEAVVRQAEAGHLSLAELDRLADQAGGAGIGRLALIFGTPNPQEIALQFLGSPARDRAIAEKEALAELSTLLADEYGSPASEASSPAALRGILARFILGAELVSALGEEIPASLREIARPGGAVALQKAVDLVRTWRQRRDLQASYVERASVVERELGVGALDWPLRALAKLETFRSLDERLQSAVEDALASALDPALINLVEDKLTGFWASAVPETMQRWALIVMIARVLREAARLETDLKTAALDAEGLATRYIGTGGAEPWALLDVSHRHMERHFHHFELDVGGAHHELEHLVALARRRYTDVATALAQRFATALRASEFKVGGLPPQSETFYRFVQPAVEMGKTAYLLVDGLRYEMARELHIGLDPDHHAELRASLGTLPSITEVGMAALLPRVHEGAELVAAGAGKVALKVGDVLLRNRKDRLEYLTASAGVRTFGCRLEALLPPNKKTRDAIQDADLIMVTATDELDGLCEAGNTPMARRLMDDVLLQIRRGLRVLFDLGVETAVVTSDHGYLFGETLDSGSMIDPPGGQTVDLHTRVWIGKGGAASESYFRVRASDIGLGGDLELAIPWSLGGFSTTGGREAYFHGAASPQELIIPVWTVRRSRPVSTAGGTVTWSLTPGSSSVSTRFLSVQLGGDIAGLFRVEPPRVRVEIREGKACLSRAVAASYGFEEATGSVKLELAGDGRSLRPNTITLMVESVPKGKKVDVVLLDTLADRILATVSGLPVTMTAF
jgi:hypothetical protein